jgi:hypothetical protein
MEHSGRHRAVTPRRVIGSGFVERSERKMKQGLKAGVAPLPINDDLWQTLRCVKTPTAVGVWIDGVRVYRGS